MEKMKIHIMYMFINYIKVKNYIILFPKHMSNVFHFAPTLYVKFLQRIQHSLLRSAAAGGALASVAE